MIMRKMIMIPEFVKMIIDRLKGAGYETYIVGGAVRDMVMCP